MGELVAAAIKNPNLILDESVKSFALDFTEVRTGPLSWKTFVFNGVGLDFHH